MGNSQENEFKMAWKIFVHYHGDNLTPLENLLNEGWWINQTNEVGNSVVYILTKSI